MPKQVIRKEFPGTVCYEYTPQELAERKLNALMDYYEKHGQMKFAQSLHTETNGKSNQHKGRS